ncbi:MAG: hypothetical protein CL681_09225 [Blastopirellula sp.]|nr:hypothetical protein [Blastopirellula sp.]
MTPVARTLSWLLLAVCLGTVSFAQADDPVFSGPQAGEPLTGFKVQPVLHADTDKPLDLVSSAKGKPIALIFVHELTRPSVGVMRVVMNYVAKRAPSGLTGGVVFLSDDRTATEALIQRAKRAMPEKTPVGISTDGVEGPGAYGLNRNVTLTVIVANENKVTANFALVQPSIQADVPKIVKAIVTTLGEDKVPELNDLVGANMRRRMADTKGNTPKPDPNIRSLLQPILQKSADNNAVDKAVAELEVYLNKNPETRQQLQAIAKRIVGSGNLENYGTPHAQKHIQNWAAGKWKEPKASGDRSEK